MEKNMKLKTIRKNEIAEYENFEIRILIKGLGKETCKMMKKRMEFFLEKLGLDGYATCLDLKKAISKFINSETVKEISLVEKIARLQRKINNAAEILLVKTIDPVKQNFIILVSVSAC
jgi:hypothetical protein